MKQCPSRSGFTLTELVVVVAILVVLAGVLVPAIGSYVDKSKIARAQSDMKEIGNAFTRYDSDTSVWPSNASYSSIATTSHDLTSFTCLFQNTYSKTGWDGPYLNKGARVGTSMQVATSGATNTGLLDPWQRPYVIYYFATGYAASGTPGSIVLLSKGPDGTTNTTTGAALASGETSGDDIAMAVTLKL